MAEFVCVSCRRRGNIDDPVRWYEGSERDVTLDPEEAAIEEGTFICGDCYAKIDPEDKPRWKPVRTNATIRPRDNTITG